MENGCFHSHCLYAGFDERAHQSETLRSRVPCFIIVLPGQILEGEHISSDFEGRFIIMSRQFPDSMFTNIQERLPLFLSIQNNPVISLSPEEGEAMLMRYSELQKSVRMTDNPYRLNIIRCLIMAFFYSVGYKRCTIPAGKEKSHSQVLVENF